MAPGPAARIRIGGICGLVLSLTVAACNGVMWRDRRPEHLCGALDAHERVLARFDVQSARLVRVRLPSLGRDPFLETDSPATVVAFTGPLRDIEIRPEGLAELADGSNAVANVCVVMATGEVRLYPNVSLVEPATAPR